MTDAPRLSGAARREYRRLTRAADMPEPTHRSVIRTPDIPVAADDGTSLLTDHWHAEGAGEHTVLIRTPYGRDGIAGVALFLAERGHHVVVQSCRGTFGSGGSFDPLHDEVDDGQATMRWLRAQSWAAGRVHSWGGSYFGVTQWAYCDGADRPDAMGIAISARCFDDAILYPGGGFSIDTPLTWAYVLDMQERSLPAKARALLRARRGFRRGALAIPPADAVRVARGADPQFFRDWVEHSDQGDPWWNPMHFAQDIDTVPPVTLVAGWQDLFLVGQLADHAALRDAGRPVRLIIGDWVHGAPEITVIGVREALRSFTPDARTEGVHLEVTGGGGWQELNSWPPPHATVTAALTADGRLDLSGAESPAAAATYRYDPADPTPDAGGRTLNPFSAGRRRQRARERRRDVLVFTGAPLPDDLVVIGAPEITLSFASTNPRADLFVRLCEVDSRGVSRALTDGYRRLSPEAAGNDADDTRSHDAGRVTLELAPLAHRFAAGSRMRVQVSSGAHPLHLRNSGTDDPVRDHSRLIPSDQILHVGGSTPALLALPAQGTVSGSEPSRHPPFTAACHDDGMPLARRLTLGDAVAIGLGSMIGAGVFAVWAPAVGVAGSGILIALAIAAVVAYCNAAASAQLAAVHPVAGGRTHTPAPRSDRGGGSWPGGAS
ncbi:CocE/NonD family hydrolase [Microbacterium sp. Se5.02b]|uniref:CocE/NonD family hydrolase n=1 Tax=Microbacterium sp. Se5.02b TaxID=2864103 RepID=UPI00215D9A35|nr:CocE/NonD family hydrolase [Microbacterium sp. Se5.02b]